VAKCRRCIGQKLEIYSCWRISICAVEHTQNSALFGLARGQFGATEINAGARIERASVRSEEVRDDGGGLRFREAQRKTLSFMSASASVTKTSSGGWSTRGALVYTERAPTYFERFSDGVHVATKAVEVGDVNLGEERASHIELGFAWKQAENRVQLNAYVTRFRDLISLEATGKTRAEGDEEPLPVYAFRAVPAQLVGAEREEGAVRLLNSPRIA
jgi:iron complex outermembrane recepter protein